jgi:hypothetical protein
MNKELRPQRESFAIYEWTMIGLLTADFRRKRITLILAECHLKYLKNRKCASRRTEVRGAEL